MSDIVMHIEGFEIHAESTDGSPRMRDLDLARDAGMSRPREIRPVIVKALEDGSLSAEDIGAVAARTVGGNGAKQDVTEYWLTEDAALFIVTRLRTPAAVAATKRMIRVYREAMRQLSAPVAPAMSSAPLQARIGDDARAKAMIQGLCRTASIVSGIHVQRIQGQIRKPWGVMSIYRIALSSFDHTVAQLRTLIETPPAKRLPADRRQRDLFGEN